MTEDPALLYVIPTRLGTRRLPGKSTRLLLGVPLAVWTMRQTKTMTQSFPGRIVVNSDDPEVKRLALGEGLEFLWRPEHLRGPRLPSRGFLAPMLEHLGFTEGVVVLPQVTSPLRDLRTCLRTIEEVCSGRSRSARTCRPDSEAPDGACYVFKAEDLLSRPDIDPWNVPGTRLFHMPAEFLSDIDTLEDFNECQSRCLGAGHE